MTATSVCGMSFAGCHPAAGASRLNVLLVDDNHFNQKVGTLKLEKLPTKVRRQLPALCEGGFVERSENVLAFGLPGRGKTHLACAIGHELVNHGYSVFFTSSVLLVQRLLIAKRELVSRLS